MRVLQPVLAFVLAAFLSTCGILLAQELSPDGAGVSSRLTPTTDTRTFSFRLSESGRYRIETSGTTQVQIALFSATDSTPLDPAGRGGKSYTPDLVNQAIEW